jgi:hypothetical protein
VAAEAWRIVAAVKFTTTISPITFLMPRPKLDPPVIFFPFLTRSSMDQMKEAASLGGHDRYFF